MGTELKMNEQFQEDWLDARLREEAPYIDDEGFTSRVIQKLPARSSQRSFRALLLCCITLLASATTYTVSGGGQFLIIGFHRLAGLPTLWILALAAISAMVFTSIATVTALAKVREERR